MADTLFETRSALRGATIDDDANPAPAREETALRYRRGTNRQDLLEFAQVSMGQSVTTTTSRERGH
jgi:hypothetical protein